MNPDRPVSPEFAAVIPVLADTMKFATQALAEATAIAELLIEKGVLTKAELDARMKSAQALREKLMKRLDEELGKVS